ncbi:hypothetical protein QTG56_24245 (plasmid) [Rossellomorea sp. AcN35-11]|nr:hypothetical protein [Rossellomorea aquimaris]WJV31751.1 hypothetical protein QTG56_24245 [Rossellomorea sp. AcN35-11]
MNIYEITTRNGNFISIGENEANAKITFTIEYPSEKIRTIKEHEGKAVKILN